ncbi:hypothetical protein AB6D72_09915 [Vibrio alginolyticus]|uniref:hypothetical protein n=1 Tax=Vibrio TaxID=662 RepID=UPI001CDD6D75|nr:MULTISPECIES: hypothetical protein [Vibrio]MCA2451653.1 hypothetical protein [Vibrio alginolyticus]MCA2475470.1 hypothetical protein [Vibrio alginolyticus]MCS0286599.1 hypothetical protein [Vibrio alginolyticus]MDW2155498.1 hypothetical protein [Vibrio sp. 2092]MDW2231656.1 hypothetical protein [Vibrio sp. 2091]
MTINEAKVTGEGAAQKAPQMERVTNFPEFIERVDAGEIILKLKLSPASKTAPSIMNVTTAITVKEPKVNYGSKVENFKYETVAFAGFGDFRFELRLSVIRNELLILRIKRMEEIQEKMAEKFLDVVKE